MGQFANGQGKRSYAVAVVLHGGVAELPVAAEVGAHLHSGRRAKVAVVVGIDGIVSHVALLLVDEAAEVGERRVRLARR